MNIKPRPVCLCGFQFAVLMWLLTYVGALFNGLTLLILGEVIPDARSAPCHLLHYFKALLSTHTCLSAVQSS